MVQYSNIFIQAPQTAIKQRCSGGNLKHLPSPKAEESRVKPLQDSAPQPQEGLSPTQAEILGLQHTIGNRRVAQLIQRRRTAAQTAPDSEVAPAPFTEVSGTGTASPALAIRDSLRAKRTTPGIQRDIADSKQLTQGKMAINFKKTDAS